MAQREAPLSGLSPPFMTLAATSVLGAVFVAAFTGSWLAWPELEPVAVQLPVAPGAEVVCQVSCPTPPPCPSSPVRPARGYLGWHLVVVACLAFTVGALVGVLVTSGLCAAAAFCCRATGRNDAPRVPLEALDARGVLWRR